MTTQQQTELQEWSQRLSDSEKQQIVSWGMELLCTEMQSGQAYNINRCLFRALSYYKEASEVLQISGNT